MVVVEVVNEWEEKTNDAYDKVQAGLPRSRNGVGHLPGELSMKIETFGTSYI